MIDRMQQNIRLGQLNESTWASDPVVALPQSYLCRCNLRRENVNGKAKEQGIVDPLCEIVYLLRDSDGSLEIRDAIGV